MSKNLPSYLKITSDASLELGEKIDKMKPDKVAILVDENTRKYCLDLIAVEGIHVIEIRSGEVNKTLQTCEHIWQQMTQFGFTRKSLLLNLGGGVIGDMGGFCAATYKRGIAFINLPTTLLSQVDASIGGKLGVDFGGLKNHIGLFQDPSAVIIDSRFLETLPPRELKSGFAEIIKHALIRSKDQWTYLQNHPFPDLDWKHIIASSIGIKNEVVSEDPLEKGLRKILNYGHTIGHAIETHYLQSSHALTHGEAVALGMQLENKLAEDVEMLDASISEDVNEYLKSLYGIKTEIPSYEVLQRYLIQDKKNDNKGLRFSLIREIGECAYDVLVPEESLKKVLK